jgi:hypothetical protein
MTGIQRFLRKRACPSGDSPARSGVCLPECFSPGTTPSLRPDSGDGREQLTDLVVLELPLDVGLERLELLLQQPDMLAQVADLELKRLAVVLPYRRRGGVEDRLRELAADLVASVVLELRQPHRADALVRRRRWQLVQERQRELTIE